MSKFNSVLFQYDQLSNEELTKLLENLRAMSMKVSEDDVMELSRLLEERTSELELAARIGQELLSTKKNLESRLASAEHELHACQDSTAQLKHQLRLKDSLLEHCSRDLEEEDDATDVSSVGFVSYQSDSGALVGQGHAHQLGQLSRKIRDLEEENVLLHAELEKLSASADQRPESEGGGGGRVSGGTCSLNEVQKTIRQLQSDLSNKSEAYLTMHCENTRLISRLYDTDNKLKQTLTENHLLGGQLQEIQAQRQHLEDDLRKCSDKYDECLNLYTETRAELRKCKRAMRNLATRPRGKRDASEADIDSAASIANELRCTALNDSFGEEQTRVRRALEQSRTIRELDESEEASAVEEEPEQATTKPERKHRISVLNDYRKVAASLGLDTDSSDSENDTIHPLQMSSPGRRRHSWYFDQLAALPNQRSSRAACSMDDLPTVATGPLASSASQIYDDSFVKKPQRLRLIKPLDGSSLLERWHHLANPSFEEALFEKPVSRMAGRASFLTRSSTAEPMLQKSSSDAPIEARPSPHVKQAKVKKEKTRRPSESARSDHWFSVGALMQAFLPESIRPASAAAAAEVEVTASSDEVSSSSGDSGSQSSAAFSFVSPSSRGLLDAGMLMESPTPQHHPHSANPGCESGSLIARLITTPPLARTRMPRGVFRANVGVLRPLHEEEAKDNTAS